MKLSDIGQAKMVADELAEIDHEITQARGDGLGVTLYGQYQDKALVDLIRPQVVEALLKKRGEVLIKLGALGVDVNE